MSLIATEFYPGKIDTWRFAEEFVVVNAATTTKAFIRFVNSTMSELVETLLGSRLICLDAHKELGLGVMNTADAQAERFISLLKREAARSEVLRKLLKEIADSSVVIRLYFGKNSASFADSATTWTIDFDDFESFPEEPDVDMTSQMVGISIFIRSDSTT